MKKTLLQISSAIFLATFACADVKSDNNKPYIAKDKSSDVDLELAEREAAPRKTGLDSDRFLVGLGSFDFHRSKHRAVAGNIEYHFMQNWLGGLNPFVGAMINHKGSVHAYAGVSLPIKVTKKIHLIPSFAPGFYLKGGGKKMGHVIEFRSQLELAYMRDDNIRVGLAINHISNASLGSKNPGAESLMLNISFPINRSKAEQKKQ